MEFKHNECKVCKCPTYKLLSEEEHTKIIKCKGCGSEYQLVTSSNQLKLRKKIEDKIKSGELNESCKEEYRFKN